MTTAGFSVSGAAWMPLLGIAVGVVLLVRGILAYRNALRLSGIATSEAAGIAAGEVRLTGIVEAGDTTLVSPLESLPCVYYRALASRGSGDERRILLDEAQAVSFRLRDATGTVTVFPRGARWEVPSRLDEDAVLGSQPAGLNLNRGSRYRATPMTREQQIAELLTVHGSSGPDGAFESASGFEAGGTLAGVAPLGGSIGTDDAWGLATGIEGASTYRESIVAPGDTITVVGSAVPFGEMPDLADSEDAGPAAPLDDPEIAADLEAAVAAGIVVGDAASAWGNAAIPGFGIGKPTRPPVLDPEARPEAVAPQATGPGSPPAPGWDLAPDALVVASVAGRPLTICAGTPAEASARSMQGFWVGLGGAVVAVASAGWLLALGGL